MNRYEFENLISDYLEGELSFSKRKEFEFYLEENEDAKLLFFRVKNTLNDMKNAEKISTSENFNSKLLSKIYKVCVRLSRGFLKLCFNCLSLFFKISF